MSKQYIKASNEAPGLGLTTWVAAATAAKVFEAPVWVYGVIGTLFIIATVVFIVRISAEEGIDVVKR